MRTRLPRYVTVSALVALAFLYVPMLAVGVLSLNASRYGTVWRGASRSSGTGSCCTTT